MGYDVGDAIRLTYEVRDDEGELVNASTVVLTVTKPDLTTETPAVSNPDTGSYQVDYLLATAGRYLFWWTTTVPNTSESAGEVFATQPSAYPTLAEVKAYLDSSQTGLSATFSDAVITEALNAEKAAQAARCRINAYYPPDLAEALKRRVQRNLAMRGLPVAVLQGDADTGSAIYLPGADPEVQRLERPYRRMVVG